MGVLTAASVRVSRRNRAVIEHNEREREREMKRVDGTDYALWFEAVFRRRKELWVSEAVGKTDARWTGRERSEVVVVVVVVARKACKKRCRAKTEGGAGKKDGRRDRKRAAPTTSPQQ